MYYSKANVLHYANNARVSELDSSVLERARLNDGDPGLFAISTPSPGAADGSTPKCGVPGCDGGGE